jgi:hypothetical protein
LLRQQFRRAQPWNAFRAASALLSVLLGAWTHILWDAFTHANGWFVLHWNWLTAPVLRVASHDVPMYHLLQHLCSVGGLLVLTLAYRAWLVREALPRSAPLPREERWRYLLLGSIVIAAIAVALPLAAHAAWTASGHPVWAAFIVRAALYGTAAFVALFALSSVVCYALRRQP